MTLESFNLEIISPSQTLIKSQADEVIIPAFEGEMTILRDHISLVTFLRPGLIEVKDKNNIHKYYAEDGTVEFNKNNLLILSSSITNVKSISNDDVDKMIIEAKKKISKREIKDKEKYILSYKIETLKNLNQ
jgi:F-type H+-transporting ATPase subunit epsilon